MAPAELVHEATDMIPMVPNLELSVDDLGDALRRPEIGAIAVRQGSP